MFLSPYVCIFVSFYIFCCSSDSIFVNCFAPVDIVSLFDSRCVSFVQPSSSDGVVDIDEALDNTNLSGAMYFSVFRFIYFFKQIVPIFWKN